MKSHLVGKQLWSALGELKPVGASEIFWEPPHDCAIGEGIFRQLPKTHVAHDGTRVLIHNPQSIDGGHSTLERRARHLFMKSESVSEVDWGRARFLPNIIQCLTHAQFIIQDPRNGNWLYGARFPSGKIQLVTVKPKEKPKGPDAVAAYLITQFVFDGGGQQKKFPIIWVCPEPVTLEKNSPQRT